MKLEIGYKNASFEIRQEQLSHPHAGSISIMYLSDFHFKDYNKTISHKLVGEIETLNPDIIFLGGDYINTKKGIIHFQSFLQGIAHRKNVFAIAGNHDYLFGIEKIEKMMEKAHVKWIEKKSAMIIIAGTKVQIDGNIFAKVNKGDIAILCLHMPVNIEAYKKIYTMAFAGHLHGCQFVLWKSDQKLYPGKLFYKWNVLHQQVGDCTFFISKGIGDTLPARYNCKRDIIVVNVNKE